MITLSGGIYGRVRREDYSKSKNEYLDDIFIETLCGKQIFVTEKDVN
jgi:hypothetical protein